MASSSSSSLSHHWIHQVFPSFCGGDVRRAFLSHILEKFTSKGITPFIDNAIKRGESIGPELVRAIRGSKIAVVLLSKKYASSSWCLNELVEIMKCREEFGQTVMTIFYEVDPTDVRKQTGDFGKAFEKTCEGKTEEVKQRWSRALMDVASIAGYHSSNWENEARMIGKITEDVSDLLNMTPSRDFEGFVGIQSHITKITSLLSLESPQVRMIGVWGTAGIGKTTIVRCLYDQISCNFQLSAFVENIKGSYLLSGQDGCCLKFPTEHIYGERRRKLNLQRQLLAELFSQKDIEVHHLGVVQERLKDQRVLVVLDDVDRLEQLDALAKETGWFGLGSRVIITTQDKKLLRALGINHIYEVDLPPPDEALQIFCQYAFGQKFPYDGFKELAWEVTKLAGTLPLGLRVLGSYLRGMTMDWWMDALPRLRSSLDGEIERTLRFSFDVLSDKDKLLFLHIACLFVGLPLDCVKLWLANSGLDVNHGLEVLTQKSLISSEMGILRMHSLLQQMGREIVRKQSFDEPGKRRFLVDPTEIYDVLVDNTGTGNVLGIRLDASKMDDDIFSGRSLEGMSNLQFLVFFNGSSDGPCLPQGLICLPQKLKLLYWENCPMRFWPFKFSTKFLVELNMRRSELEKLWQDIQPLRCLKVMDLSFSMNLKEIPDLSTATNLQKLILTGCSSLTELTPSTGNAVNLQELTLEGCSSLVELPSSIGNLDKLEVMNMSGCKKIKALPTNIDLESLSKLDLSDCLQLKVFPEISRNIQELNLSATAIKEVPSSVRSWSRLYKLDMSRCRSLKVFPNVPESIELLELSYTQISQVPPWVDNLFHLRELLMFRCARLKQVSPNISKLESLQNLRLFVGGDIFFTATIKWGSEFNRKCWTLQSDIDVRTILPICLPEQAYNSPVSLDLRNNKFRTLPSCFEQLSQLHCLVLFGCSNLVSLPQLPDSLTSLDAEGCTYLKRIRGSFRNPEICFNFANCFRLRQKARDLIRATACKHALLPCTRMPAFFTHRASGSSLTINLNQRLLPTILRFKACIMIGNFISVKDEYIDDNDEDYDESVVVHVDDYDRIACDYSDGEPKCVSCRVTGKQNGLVSRYGSIKHHLPAHLELDHLYMFEASFPLKEGNDHEAEPGSCELFFDFKIHTDVSHIYRCGVQIIPHGHEAINVDCESETETDSDINSDHIRYYKSRKNDRDRRRSRWQRLMIVLAPDN